jgi:hypothetical protein
MVTPVWNPGGSGGTYNNHPVGVYYNSGNGQWAIFQESPRRQRLTQRHEPGLMGAHRTVRAHDTHMPGPRSAG